MSVETVKLDYAREQVNAIKAGAKLIVIPAHYTQADRDWLIDYVNSCTQDLNNPPTL